MTNLNQRLTGLESKVTGVAAPDPEPIIDFNLPANNIDELLLLESKLNESEENEKQFVHTLQLIGGVHLKNCVFRVLQKVFTYELGKQCSLTGQRNNFRLKDLKLTTLMREAVKKNFPQMKEVEYEETFKLWFRQASQRLMRLQSRMTPIS